MGCFLGIKTHTALSMVVEIGGHKSIALKERHVRSEALPLYPALKLKKGEGCGDLIKTA